MKTFPALFIDPQGVVRYNLFPEEPEYNGEIGHSINVQKEYYAALAAAKQSAIEVQPQGAFTSLGKDYIKPDTIHPLPTGRKVEVKNNCPTWCSDCKAFDWSTCKHREVAILTPDPIPDSGNKVESQTIEQYFRACYGTDDPRTMKFDGRDMVDFAEAWAAKEVNDLQKENSDLRAQLGRVKKGELRLEAVKKRLLKLFAVPEYPNKDMFFGDAVRQIIEEEIKVKPRHKD